VLRLQVLMSSMAWMLGLLLFAGGARAELAGCHPASLTGPVAQAEVCYGPAAWREPTLGGKVLVQSFDFYPAVRARRQGAPLIVWAHPNGSTKALPLSSSLFKALVAPALASGFAFASVEYRHPVVNEYARPDGRVPHRDLARALQFMRANAAALGIDPAYAGNPQAAFAGYVDFFKRHLTDRPGPVRVLADRRGDRVLIGTRPRAALCARARADLGMLPGRTARLAAGRAHHRVRAADPPHPGPTT
jgi:hypothetical protein